MESRDSVTEAIQELCDIMEGQQVWCKDENTNDLTRDHTVTLELLRSVNPFGVMAHLQQVGRRYRYYLQQGLFRYQLTHLQGIIDTFLDSDCTDLVHRLCLAHYIDESILQYINRDMNPYETM